MRYNMGILDRVRGGNWRWTITAEEMRENGDIGDGSSG